jgi:hypothetical protein
MRALAEELRLAEVERERENIRIKTERRVENKISPCVRIQKGGC